MCLNCGKEFQETNYHHGTQKYCSGECESYAWHRKNKLKDAESYQRNKEKIKKGNKKRYEDNKLSINKKRKELSRKRRRELENLIGNKCVLCGSSGDLRFHEIHGKKHPLSRGDNKKIHDFMVEHHKNFVSLCRRCHNWILHYIARIPNFDLEKFAELLKQLER